MEMNICGSFCWNFPNILAKLHVSREDLCQHEKKFYLFVVSKSDKSSFWKKKTSRKWFKEKSEEKVWGKVWAIHIDSHYRGSVVVTELVRSLEGRHVGAWEGQRTWFHLHVKSSENSAANTWSLCAIGKLAVTWRFVICPTLGEFLCSEFLARHEAFQSTEVLELFNINACTYSF